MKIGILGTRGIPARYGGFETLAEELSARLAARGHDVTVYTRPRYAERGLTEWRGAKVRVLPTIPTKYLDTVAHGLLSGLDAAFERFDSVLVCNAINAAASFLPRLVGRTRVVLNVDGLERHRRKWSAVGQLAYEISEKLSTIVPDAVVSDARVIRDYYRNRYGFESHFIPYGGDLPEPAGRETLERLGLERERYVLYVSRLEPENNADAVVRAYRDVPGQTPLVVVGDAPYAKDYIARVKALADPRVTFPGAIYGEGYRELLSSAAVYVHATEVGGTHPALVEALGYGRPVVYNATPENEEVAGGAGLPFDVRQPETLTRLLTGILDDPDSASVWKERARARATERYRWDDVADRYEAVLRGVGLR
ncbi:MAG TPA: glycosyltransferase [Thermoanaerobaculia bacterium]|jgi:glycosyltransferase involved in cell wall biosynthesis|nr:glycosyltransferase [Thermoanaerobaculia bacterium]